LTFIDIFERDEILRCSAPIERIDSFLATNILRLCRWVKPKGATHPNICSKMFYYNISGAAHQNLKLI